MIIDIKEIIDYHKCPMLYKLKYIDKLGVSTTNLNEKYENDIHKLMYSSFLLAQEGEPIKMDNLKRTWGKLWIRDRKKNNIVFADGATFRDTYSNKRKEGINALIKFYDNFYNDVGFPIIINKKYSVNIAKNLTITGNFELFREVKDEKDNAIFELVDFKANDKANNKVFYSFDIESLTASFALRKLYNVKEDRIMYYSVEKGKKTYITKNDNYKELINTLTCIAKNIHNKIFYIYPDIKCGSCVYKNKCIKEIL